MSQVEQRKTKQPLHPAPYTELQRINRLNAHNGARYRYTSQRESCAYFSLVPLFYVNPRLSVRLWGARSRRHSNSSKQQQSQLNILAVTTNARLGFPHRAGRYRPGGPSFSSPVRRSYRGMKGSLIRGWGLILPACGETLTFPREATPATHPARLDWPRAGGEAPSANGIGAQKTLD